MQGQKADSGFQVPSSFGDLVVGEYKGKKITVNELPDGTKNILWNNFSGFHRLLSSSVKDYAESQYFLEKSGGDTSKAKEAKEAAKKIVQATDAEIKELYERNKASIPYPFEAIRDELRKHIETERKTAAENRLEQEVKTFSNYSVTSLNVAPMKIAIDVEGYPSKGNVGASTTLVEYADFTCPHCQVAAPILNEIVEKRSKTLSLVFKFYPRDGVPMALESALAGYCAHKQDKFWKYHDLVYDRKNQDLSEAILNEIADKIALDIPAWSACRESIEAKNFIADSKRSADRVGLMSTPTFFLDGVLVTTDDSLEKLRQKIDLQTKP